MHQSIGSLTPEVFPDAEITKGYRRTTEELTDYGKEFLRFLLKGAWLGRMRGKMWRKVAPNGDL